MPTTPERDLRGHVALVTGANTGIGRVTAETLARWGAHVYLACRSEEKTAPVVDAIRAAGGQVSFLALDLGDLDSVRACAAAFLAAEPALHLCVANAGLAGFRGLTPSGFELCFGVNHVGHYLLVRLLEPALRQAARPEEPARVVVVSSDSHATAKGIDFAAVRTPTRSPTSMAEYGVSKLANILFAKEISRRWADAPVVATSLHPGVVASDIWRRIPGPFRWIAKRFMITVEEGAQTTLHCATSPHLEPGAYYVACRERAPAATALDAGLAVQLWEESARWVGLDGHPQESQAASSRSA
ncbi:MAG: SDR family NAD(P)-dependent oxidoreductase [Myxococcales bacterium]|nr:SDR family NAD(P)-dependent oxidoreductase [Myxococcales bacterium]